MGQYPSIPSAPTQRIKPTPGASGSAIYRRNTLFLYSDSSHKILKLRVSGDMKISEVKQLLGNNFSLMLKGELLPEDKTLAELGVSERTLVKVVAEEFQSDKSSSTFDSSADSLEIPRTIGPKKEEQPKPAKPSYESTLIESLEEASGIDLESLAAPDLELEKKSKPKSSLY